MTDRASDRDRKSSERDGFSDAVEEFLRAQGWEPAHADDGGAFGLDFAIESPVTGLYAIGIECDAPRHRILETARAREVWRPSVLRHAVPHVHRVSSYGWVHARDEEQSRLKKAVRARASIRRSILMSGPKVFHIVTREEIIAICQGHLARLDAAVAEWQRICGRNNAATESDIKALSARRDALHGLLAQDKFTELQKQVPAEISFIGSDGEERVRRAAAAVAEARQRARRAVRTAQTLLEALDKSGRKVPDEIRRGLEFPGTQSVEFDTTLSKAFALLSDGTGSAGVSDRQRDLAAQLGRGEKRATLADWIATQVPADDDEHELRIDRHLADLSALEVDIRPFEARASAISNEPTSRQSLLADSLLIDLAQAVKSGREQAALMAKLREKHVEISRLKAAEAQSLHREIDAALAKRNMSSMSTLIARADVLLTKSARSIAASARRQAILQGLAGLGYEVTEGMATAWVEGGRVVVRKAANRDYGVELVGGAQSDRFQVRAVAFGGSHIARDAARDQDMETIWCGEFEKLQGLVAKDGGYANIERAMPVGAAPMKVIEDHGNGEQSEGKVPAARMMRP